MNKVFHHLFWHLDDLHALDPVDVHIMCRVNSSENPDLFCVPFSITLNCWGEVWTTSFGSPTGTPCQFLREAPVDYIVNRLHDTRHKTKASHKIEYPYIKRIWEAVREKLWMANEVQQRELAKLAEANADNMVVYESSGQAPNVLDNVLVQYVGDPNFYGPALASLFPWGNVEGEPCIDKFWFIREKVNNDGV